MSEITLEQARAVLEAQPFNAALGARLTQFGGGIARLELDVEERHLQQQGRVHGGVLAYLADNVLTFAAGTVLGAAVLTSGLTIHYLHGPRGGTLRAHGQVVHHTSRQAVCSVTVDAVSVDGDVRSSAFATGTVVSLAR